MRAGEKIRKFRLAKKLTQEDMANALNITQRAYSKIENDEVKLKIDRLNEIANILNVEIAELLPGNPVQQIENVTYSQIGNGKVINKTGDKERELYEKIIEKQEQEINYLKGIIEILKK